jgi:hypothetical protein
MRIRVILNTLAVLLLVSMLRPAQAQLTISTSNSTDWKIANGSISMDWDSTTGRVWSMYLTGYSTDLVDTTHSGGDGHPSGLYMDNDGTDMPDGDIGNTGVTPTASYSLVSGKYLDWWISWAANSSNPFEVTEHFIVQPNDPTLYSYYVINHAASAATGYFAQIQYVYRINVSEFLNTYSVNSGLNNLGATEIVLPSNADLWTTETDRAVQNAVTDLHGFSLLSGYGREFYTKYDYSSYEYLHQAHGLYGPTFGAWTIIPSTESYTGGPSKQDLIFTGNILMGEVSSAHFNSDLEYSPVQGTATTRIFGPVGFHFNAFNKTITTPAQMYQDALNTIPSALTLFANDAELLANGYVPTGSDRGTVDATITDGGSSTPNTAWTVLSDQNANQQYSDKGYEYWQSNNSDGKATLSNIVPGTYRLSSYVLGEWGELREDGIKVTAGETTNAEFTFTPENFSTEAPIWTIGTPDRSSHEFLHGENNYGSVGSCAGCDDRQFYGNWNYWKDFESTNGAVNYYATAVGSTPATNNPLAWNYTQWGTFDPGLYAGIYNSSDASTDGYKYIIPSYVSSVTASVPAWQVHFATTSAQNAQGGYVDLSVGLSCVEENLSVSLNGHALNWSAINKNDCMVRSGFSGYYQWVVFEWPTSDLAAAGNENTLTLSVNGGGEGVQYDALRMEISSKGANPSTTGWHDYEYIASGTDIAANDSISNNGTGGSTSCTPTSITPYIYANGAWTQESSVTVSSASTLVDLGPQPISGTWNWTGPNNFTSTAREIDSIPLTVGTDTYVATYTNASGCSSKQTFTITVQ